MHIKGGQIANRMQHEAYKIVHPSRSIKRTVARIVSFEAVSAGAGLSKVHTKTKYPSPYESLDPPIGKPQEGPDEDAGLDVVDAGGEFKEQEDEEYVAEDIQRREDGIS